jgi:hypothetical protein
MRRAALICAVLAICHAYLGDRWHMRDYINRAHKTLADVDKLPGYGFLVNPLDLPYAWKLLREEDFYDFHVDNLETVLRHASHSA